MSLKKEDQIHYDIKNYEFATIAEETNKGIHEENLKKLSSRFVEDTNNESYNLNPGSEFESSLYTGFEVEDIVKESRRHHEYRRGVLNREVEAKVTKLFTDVKGKAFEEGFAEGKQDAQVKLDELIKAAYEEKVQKITEFTNELERTKDQIIEEYEDRLLEIVKTLSKWMVLKESELEGYLPRLLKQVVSEADNFKRLTLVLDKRSFEKYDELISELPEIELIKDFKVKEDLHAKYHGFKFDTDRFLVDATLEEKFDLIEKLFEKIGEDRASRKS